jgi:hypothetical protein
MKVVILAALALVSLASSALAGSLNPGIMNQEMRVTLGEFSGAMPVVDRKRKRKNNWSQGGFIPGYVLTPYGRRDCIGWWHRHSNGRLHCHGQLIGND